MFDMRRREFITLLGGDVASQGKGAAAGDRLTNLKSRRNARKRVRVLLRCQQIL
jgi:hypothetical protein